MSIDLLVHGGDVLTVDEAGTVVRDGAVAVHEGEIVAVGTAEEVRARFTAADVIDAAGCLVLPGGRVLMRDRALTTLDEAAVVQELEALV